MNYILKRRLKYCTKEIIKVSKIIAVALIFIIGIILIKYKPLYKVEIDNIEIGYVKNKKEFNSLINEFTESKTQNVAFITLNSKPEYEFKLVSNEQQTNEDAILEDIKENSITTYTVYGITVNEDIKTYVNTEEEAEIIVNSIKEEYSQNVTDINVAVKQIYTEENIETAESDDAIQTVAEIADAKIEEMNKQKEKENAIAVVNDVIIAAKPVTGTITARFGEVSRVRSSSHTGLDIAAPTGTAIKACSSGTIEFAGSKGSYGKLVKIRHENGVETWYAHCSKLYVKEGQKVEAGETIAAVGSTGNSTGSHLHLEIRINGTAVNPQKYMYK